ncbi:MAG: hypothetical protein IJ005_02260 [Bacteroidales bacterium]|nr:hypothetical protein [Bacteroidales bacterium]
MKMTFTIAAIMLLMLVGCDKEIDTLNELPDNNEIIVDDITISPITLCLNQVTSTTATFSAQLNMDLMAEYQEAGFLYSTEERLDVESELTTKVKVSREYYSETIVDLFYNTDYYYTVYTVKNGVYHYGDTQSFKTDNLVGIIDLSQDSSANCYIVSKPGIYEFETVQGNSEISVGNVASVSVLWESFGTDEVPSVEDLIKSTYRREDYIAFQAPDTFNEGNAVIAAIDINGEILWSWHIWFTDRPEEQIYKRNAGTMMDRNLGATSSIPGDVRALGLLYQWGRKDPFLGSSSISSAHLAKSTIEWPAPISSDELTGTVNYTIAHPTTYIKNSPNWYYSSNTDHTLWSSQKTIYDPCPPGWRVPDGGEKSIWAKAINSANGFKCSYDSSNNGIEFTEIFGNGDDIIWYPCAGYRKYSSGGQLGMYWFAVYWSANIYRCFSFEDSGYAHPNEYYDALADGRSVRCQKIGS